MVWATINVTRDGEDIEVEVFGRSEYFGSSDPFECGEHIADWCVESPKGFDLSEEERRRAEEALEAQL